MVSYEHTTDFRLREAGKEEVHVSLVSLVGSQVAEKKCVVVPE